MKKEYIFVSYAHKDRRAVLKELTKREAKGQQFWVDDNIEAGTDWAESIGKNLSNAVSVLYFDSKYSEKSENCKRELVFAKEHQIPIETVKLKTRHTFVWLLAILTVVLLSIAVKSLMGIIPDVIGKDVESGRATIIDSGFKCHTVYDYSNDVPLGVISFQNRTGNSLRVAPVSITESLGFETNLAWMPDTVGSYVSDGITTLIKAGFMRFRIHTTAIATEAYGEIKYQSAPAGYMISKDNTIALTVAGDGTPIQFEYNGYLYTLEEGLTLDLSEPSVYGLTEEELALFNDNKNHTIWDPEDYDNVWFPAQSETVMVNNEGTCFGWVIVRDTVIAAENLFKGYSELYVCPGITVTVMGKVSDHEGDNYFYVAKGGTLIFDDEVNGGVYLVNDGNTLFKKSVSKGKNGVTIANRGSIQVEGTINQGVNGWSFYQSSISGGDQTGGTLHDYSPYEIVNASRWYEGCTGANGFGTILDKLQIFFQYKQHYKSQSSYSIAPVIQPEDYEENYTKEFYTSSYLFLIDYTVTEIRQGRGQYWEFIAAPGVTLTINNENLCTFLVAEKGSTIIVNGDIKGHYPYCPWFVIDGTLILNGNYEWKYGTDPIYVANRGTFQINGTFGGERTYLYNFKGSSCSGTILPDTYVANIDWVPDYQTYGNDDPNCAIGYDESVLRHQGYRWKYDEQEKYDQYKDTVYPGE